MAKNTLQIIIDGITHEYTKASISDYACESCSLERHCKRAEHTHLCRALSTENGRYVCGYYGHFKIVEK